MGPHCVSFSRRPGLSHHGQRALAVHLWSTRAGRAGLSVLLLFSVEFCKGSGFGSKAEHAVCPSLGSLKCICSQDLPPLAFCAHLAPGARRLLDNKCFLVSELGQQEGSGRKAESNNGMAPATMGHLAGHGAGQAVFCTVFWESGGRLEACDKELIHSPRWRCGQGQKQLREDLGARYSARGTTSRNSCINRPAQDV